MGLAVASVGVEVGGAFVEFHQGDATEPERPLLNHLAMRVESANEKIMIQV